MKHFILFGVFVIGGGMTLIESLALISRASFKLTLAFALGFMLSGIGLMSMILGIVLIPDVIAYVSSMLERNRAIREK